MTGIPKAGRPQEPTGTSRGGIACSTATMQDPGNGSLRQTLLRAHRHQAPSTSASDPARFSRRQGVTAGTFATLLCERKHRRPVTSGDAGIVPLTLGFAVVVCRLLPSGCRAFAACMPPAAPSCGLVRNVLRTVRVDDLRPR